MAKNKVLLECKAVLRVGQRSTSQTTTEGDSDSSSAEADSDVEQDSEEYESFTRESYRVT